jgi:hypothetical protein
MTSNDSDYCIGTITSPMSFCNSFETYALALGKFLFACLAHEQIYLVEPQNQSLYLNASFLHGKVVQLIPLNLLDFHCEQG